MTEARRRARWLIYALGGGLGHVTRGMALARTAAMRGHDITVVASSTLAAAIQPDSFSRLSLPSNITLQFVDPSLNRVQLQSALGELQSRESWDALIVDTFPRGILGELPDLLNAAKMPRVLVNRCLNPEYVAQYKLANCLDRYDLILLPGEDAFGAAHPKAIRTAPWLIREAVDLPGFEIARRNLIDSTPENMGQQLVLVSGCGEPAEIEHMARVADALADELAPVVVRFAAPNGSGQISPPIRHYPLIEVLPGVDVLIGSGGYNTVHECRATNTPLLAYARPRRYDLQRERLRTDERIDNPNDLPKQIRSVLRTATPAIHRAPAQYENGAHAAVKAIEGL